MEIVVPVEGGSSSIDGVDNDKLAAGDTGGFDNRAERSYQEFGPESLTVKVLAQGKFGEQDRRDLAGGSSGDLVGCVGAVEDVRGDSEVPGDHAMAIQNDEGTRALSRSQYSVIA
ncbi:MAG: hypothetical protein Q8Q52_00105 [Acidimicrobiia bacterium]|nr:hypothetical protein [Acidimicrobiia bacterium]